MVKFDSKFALFNLQFSIPAPHHRPLSPQRGEGGRVWFSGSPKRSGFTLLELAVVLAIITLLVSALLPAVQSARERARTTACENKLRQLTLGVTLHENSHQRFPSDGWGFAWVGDKDGQAGDRHPGGWIHAVLPFIEQQEVWDQTGSPLGRTRAMAMPLPLLVCPSRRDGQTLPYTLDRHELRNAAKPGRAAKTDYAACAGDQLVPIGPGPESNSEYSTYEWPDAKRFTGIIHLRSATRGKDIYDGLSNTMLLAEKSMSILNYTGGDSDGDDQSVLIGDDADIRRWTQFSPRQDSNIDDIESFGSPHPGGLSAAMADGSVRRIHYDIDLLTYQRLGTRRDL